MSRTCSLVLSTALSVAGFLSAQTKEVTLTITKTPSSGSNLNGYGLRNVVPGIGYPEWFGDPKLSSSDREHLVTLYNQREWLRFQDQLNSNSDPLKIQQTIDLVGALGGALNPESSQVTGGNKYTGVQIKPRDGYQADQTSDLETPANSTITGIDKEIGFYGRKYDVPPSLRPDPNYANQLTPDKATQLLMPAAKDAAKPVVSVPWAGANAATAPTPITPGGIVSGASFDPATTLSPEGRAGFERNQAIIRSETLGVSGTQPPAPAGTDARGGINFKRGQAYQPVEGLDKELERLRQEAAKSEKPEAKKQ